VTILQNPYYFLSTELLIIFCHIHINSSSSSSGGGDGGGRNNNNKCE
jgi:hypothetical protein